MLFYAPIKNFSAIPFFLKILLKNLILSNFLFYFFYLKASLSKSSLLLALKVSKLKTKRILTQEGLINKVAHAKNHRSEVCHIIGSGWSLTESLAKVLPNDYVVGFNYSGLCDLAFDLYIAEFGGFSVSNASFDHLKIAKELSCRAKPPFIVFKNIWEGKNDLDFINEHWVELAWFVLDRIYPLPRLIHLRKALKLMLNDKSHFFPQCVSTIVFTILLAYKSGFKTIVLHGVDFGGRYFYECDGFNPSILVFPSNKSQAGFYGKSSVGSVHPTALGRIGLQDLLLEFNRIFVDSECRLLCGTSSSPSSEILSVYRPQLKK